MEFNKRLNDIRKKFENGETPQKIIDVLNAHVDDLLSQGLEKQAISVGNSAPLDGSIWDTATSLTLADLVGDKFLVLTWFRGNW